MRVTPGALCVLSLAVGANLPAQVPDGSLLVGSFRYSGSTPQPVAGPGGLFYVDPGSGVITPVTGLPPDLTGAVPASTLAHGLDFVVRVPGTERLIANGWGDSTVGAQMPVFVLQMQGTAVQSTTRYDVGIIDGVNRLGLPEAEALPDGRVVIGVDPTTFRPGEPLSGTVLAIFDPTRPPGSPGALTSLPVSLPAGRLNALAVDVDRGVAWIGTSSGELYSVPFPQGGPAQLQYRSFSTVIAGLDLAPDGSVFICGWNLSNNMVLSHFVPGSRFPTPFRQVAAQRFGNGVRVDPVAGDLYFTASTGQGDFAIYRISPADPVLGVLTTIAPVPTGGWGLVASLDLNEDPEIYGEPSGPAATDVAWSLAPNARGLPTLGNTGFGLELLASPVPAAAGVLVGHAPTTMPFPPLQILTTPIDAFLIPPGPTMPVPLGIPNDPVLRGVQVFVQGVFADTASRLGGTAGVHVTVL